MRTPHLFGASGPARRSLPAVSIAPQPERRAAAGRPIVATALALLVLLAVALLVRP